MNLSLNARRANLSTLLRALAVLTIAAACASTSAAPSPPPVDESELLGLGFKVLVATPFGPQWYPYLMRRLGERPANMLFIARNLVRR